MNTEVSTETTSSANPIVKGARKAPKKVGKAAKAAKKVTKKAETEAAPATGNGTPLKSICAKLRIDPKLARRKLRAAKLDFHGARERWTFTAKQAAKVTEILSA